MRFEQKVAEDAKSGLEGRVWIGFEQKVTKIAKSGLGGRGWVFSSQSRRVAESQRSRSGRGVF